MGYKFMVWKSTVFSLGGFVALFFLNWKIGLCVLFIVWGGNIANHVRYSGDPFAQAVQEVIKTKEKNK